MAYVAESQAFSQRRTHLLVAAILSCVLLTSCAGALRFAGLAGASRPVVGALARTSSFPLSRAIGLANRQGIYRVRVFLDGRTQIRGSIHVESGVATFRSELGHTLLRSRRVGDRLLIEGPDGSLLASERILERGGRLERYKISGEYLGFDEALSSSRMAHYNAQGRYIGASEFSVVNSAQGAEILLVAGVAATLVGDLSNPTVLSSQPTVARASSRIFQTPANRTTQGTVEYFSN